VQDMAGSDWKEAKAWHGGIRALVTVALTK
jgi:hypothetical protein